MSVKCSGWTDEVTMNQKIPATIREQVQKLRQRGCIIEDEKHAEETLKYINYFRLADYFAPFTVDRKSTRLNSSHYQQSRMPSSA